ncbi:2-oxoacid:acceptor oxidoreductase subunit alpha, partial [Staphylococcus cohnii]
LMNEQLNNVDADFILVKTYGKTHLYMIGNDAIGLGALSAGSRFMAAYPITPASEIMEYMIENLPKVGGTVVQTEDEIAAANMAIGSNYAGVRAFTASAGPGLSLMMEAIGLSGMTETPFVVINTQRGGPSTGLPTKQEQSDLMQMIYGTHGDIPKIVVAPTDAEDAFYLTMEAFNLAEQYQCPVIVLS